MTNFGSNLHASSTQMVGSIKESYTKHPRDMKISPGTAPINWHFMTTRLVVEVVSDILRQLKWALLQLKRLYLT